MNESIFEISDDKGYCYFFNNSLIENNGGEQVKLTDSELLRNIEIIKSSNYSFVVLDLTYARSIQLSENDFSVFDCEKIIFSFNNTDFIKKLDNNKIVIDDNETIMFYSGDRNNICDFINKISMLKDKGEKIKWIVRSFVLTRFIYNDMLNYNHVYSDDKLKYLESSNVFVNKYINIKAFFQDRHYINYLINNMSELLKEKFPDRDSCCLLGVSNNGMILSRLIGYNLDMDVKSINHLGPKYYMNSGSKMVDDLKEKKFILISDVICLGGEYRQARSILDVLGSTLLGAISVVKIYDVYRSQKEEQVFALINRLNDYSFNEMLFDYTIQIDRRYTDESKV